MKFPLSKLPSVLTLVLLIVLQAHCECPTCVDLSYYGCKVCYDNCTASPEKQFINCDYTYCSDYSYDSNGTATCIGYDTKSLPENECFSQCCQSSETVFTVQLLQQCEEKSKRNTTIVIAVVCSFFGLIILIVIICFCCCGRCGCIGDCCRGIGGCIGDFCGCLGDCLGYIFKCKCCRKPSFEAPSNHQIQVASVKQYKWEQQPSSNEVIEDETCICSICLMNRADTVSKCRHCFHVDCISEWLNRNPHCPVCRSEEAHFVKFYCRGCCKSFVQFDLAKEKNTKQVIASMKGPNCQTCQ